MTPEEMKIIKKSARILYPDDIKFLLMIELLLVCGFRINEELHLKIMNVDFETEIIRIIRKRNKIHQFYVGQEELMRRIQKYCMQNDITKPDDFIFPKDNMNNPYSYTTITYIFRRIFEAADLEYGRANGGFTTHDFRRTCASSLSAQGLTLQEIADILGHNDVRQTADYITPIIDDNTKARRRKANSAAFNYK